MTGADRTKLRMSFFLRATSSSLSEQWVSRMRSIPKIKTHPSLYVPRTGILTPEGHLVTTETWRLECPPARPVGYRTTGLARRSAFHAHDLFQLGDEGFDFRERGPQSNRDPGTRNDGLHTRSMLKISQRPRVIVSSSAVICSLSRRPIQRTSST